MACIDDVAPGFCWLFGPRAFAHRRIRSAGVAVAIWANALPGSVLAVAESKFCVSAFGADKPLILIPATANASARRQPAPLLLGSLFACYCLSDPFLCRAYGPLDTSLARIRPSLPEARRVGSRAGGSSPGFKIWPCAAGILSAALLVVLSMC